METKLEGKLIQVSDFDCQFDADLTFNKSEEFYQDLKTFEYLLKVKYDRNIVYNLRKGSKLWFSFLVSNGEKGMNYECKVESMRLFVLDYTLCTSGIEIKCVFCT